MSDPIVENEDAIERLELQVGRLLEAGVIVSAACLAIGLVLWMIARDSPMAHVLLTAGLVVLMLTPLARVVASFVAWVRLRDWFFVATTVMVFVVLMAAWLLKQ
jgi:uncharacterized membrane protein